LGKAAKEAVCHEAKASMEPRECVMEKMKNVPLFLLPGLAYREYFFVSINEWPHAFSS